MPLFQTIYSVVITDTLNSFRQFQELIFCVLFWHFPSGIRCVVIELQFSYSCTTIDDMSELVIIAMTKATMDQKTDHSMYFQTITRLQLSFLHDQFCSTTLLISPRALRV